MKRFVARAHPRALAPAFLAALMPKTAPAEGPRKRGDVSSGHSNLSKAIRVAMAIAVAMGICMPLLASTGNSRDKAYAADVETVSTDDFTTANHLLITNYTAATVAQNQPNVKSATTGYKAVRATQPGNESDWIGLLIGTKSGDKQNWLNANVMTFVPGYNESALNIQFTDLTSSGQSGSVTVNYPLVGTYNDKQVGAEVTYTVHFEPDDIKANGGASYGQYWQAWKNPGIQIADDMFYGVFQYGCSSVDTHYSFYYKDSGEAVNLQNSYFTIGSLTPANNNPTTGTTASGYKGECITSNAGYMKIQIPEGGCVVSNGSSTHSANRMAKYVDSPGGDNYWSQSATFWQNGTFDFTFSRSQNDKYSASKGQTWNDTSAYWSIASSSIQPAAPPAPVKAVDKTDAVAGDTLTYTVAQEVNTLNTDTIERYTSFAFTDPLPEQLTYVDGSTKITQEYKGAATDVTAKAGSVKVSGQTVTYTFNDNYLKSMPLDGETYTMTLQATVNRGTGDGTKIDNQGTTSINNNPFPTNTVETIVHEIHGHTVTTYKSSDPIPGTKVAAGDTIKYTLNSINTGDEAAPYTLVRDYIPTGTAYENGTVSDGGAYVASDAAGNTTGKAYVEWVLRDIAVNATVPVSFSVTVAADHPSVIANAGLTSQPPTPITPGDPANPEPTDPTNVITHPTGEKTAGPDVNVVKASDPVPGTYVSGNGTIKYALTVTNDGDEDARNVAVYDAIPAGTSYVEGSVSLANSGQAVNGGSAVAWVIPTVAKGQSIQLSFSVKVNADASDGAVIQNQASFASNHPDTPIEPLDNTTNITQHPVSYSVDVDKNLIGVNDNGTEATYEIDVTNHGKSTLVSYQLKDTPDNLTYKSSDGTYNADTQCFTIASLASGDTAKITAVYTIANVTDEIGMNGTANHVVPASDDGYTLGKTRVTSATDMTPAKGTVMVGQTIYYLITLANTSAAPMAQQTVTDIPAMGLTITAAAPADGNGAATVNSDGSVTWETGVIPASGKATMLVTATATEAAVDGGVVTNKAKCGPFVVVVTDPLVEDGIVKSCTPASGSEVKAGDIIEYTLTVSNDSVKADAQNVAVYDAIPQNTTYIDGSVSADNGGTYLQDSNAVAWVIPVVAKGRSVDVKFSVKVNDDITAGTEIDNVATCVPNHPDTPTEPLENLSNQVNHHTPSANPVGDAIGAAMDKTGNLLARHWWIVALIAAAAACAGAYGIKQRRASARRKMLKRMM